MRRLRDSERKTLCSPDSTPQTFAGRQSENNIRTAVQQLRVHVWYRRRAVQGCLHRLHRESMSRSHETEQFIADLKQIHNLVNTGAPLTIESRIEPGETGPHPLRCILRL